MQKSHGRRLRRGARLECTLRIAGAGDAEMGWEEATEGEFERTLTLEMQK